MRTLIQPWLCHLSLLALALFSLVSGFILEIGALASSLAVSRYIGNRPLPVISQWFLSLHIEHTHTLFTLSFYPTVAASAYLFFLFHRVRDEQERCARFALVAFTSLAAILSFLVLGAFSFALPFIPFSDGRLRGPVPETPAPFLQETIWMGLLILFFVSGLLLVRLFLSARRSASCESKQP